MTTKQWPFLCKDSGKSFGIHKVAFSLNAELTKRYPAPRPPVVDVVLAGGVHQQEENRADPDFVQAMQDYRLAQEQRLQKLIIQRAIVYALSDEDKQDVQDLRAQMDSVGVTLSPNDFDVWVWHIAITTPDEYKELVREITQRSQATVEGVTAASERFRADGEVSNSNGPNL